MKVIFLDVDGVLNCKHTKEVIWRDNGKQGYHGVEDGKIELLLNIVKATGAVIVLSSTWRLNKVKSIFDNYLFLDDLDDEEYDESPDKSAYRYLEMKLGQYGLEIYDDTPDSGGAYSRGKEINQWLEEHPDVTDYVILDDDEFRDFETYGLSDYVVYTTYRKGLMKKQVEEAIEILSH